MNGNKHNVLLLIGSIVIVLLTCIGTVSAATVTMTTHLWNRAVPDFAPVDIYWGV
jgi:cell division protein FtsL